MAQCRCEKFTVVLIVTSWQCQTRQTGAWDKLLLSVLSETHSMNYAYTNCGYAWCDHDRCECIRRLGVNVFAGPLERRLVSQWDHIFVCMSLLLLMFCFFFAVEARSWSDQETPPDDNIAPRLQCAGPSRECETYAGLASEWAGCGLPDGIPQAVGQATT